MTTPVEFFVFGIESKQVIALLIVKRLLDADIQVVGVDHCESACLLRQKIQPFERLLRCLQRVRMRIGAGAAPDVRGQQSTRQQEYK
jgi:hypothetical protein